MNPAIHAALIAAASKQASEESVEARLREAGATDPAQAMAFDAKDKAEQKLLDQAIARGTIGRTADGRVYLDEQAVSDRKESQGHMLLVILLIAASLIASGAALVLLTES